MGDKYTPEELEAAGLDESEMDALNDVPDENYKQPEEDPEPVKAEDPEPVKAEDPEPVKAEEDPEPVKAEDPEPVKAEDPEPVKAEDPEPVKAEDPEPVKAEEDPEPVKAEPWFTANRDAVNKPVEDAANGELQRLDGVIQGLHDRFEAGDLERRDYDDAVAKARESRVDVKRHLDHNKDRNAEYCGTLDTFFAKPENAVFKDPGLFSLLDAQVRIIAQAAPQKSDAQVLGEARQYLVDLEVKGLAKAPLVAAKAVKAGKPAAKVPDHVEKTLTDVPAAAPESTGDKSRFAHLEGLDGDALETAVANMTRAEEDAWLDETAP